ncbi:hypothetical protein Pint_35611 [Pistacia integerrima]|uniref:Uncharacterized protein n=1 Tax=Pistacia integerrima TaxID=434235 RepID=A0ACC0Y011_9ROSI|nr:hypothetical protein Pint_35611 [Pistacia integerrima]
MLWNRRLGHIGEKELQVMSSKKIVEGVPNCTMRFGFCGHCLHGKQNRVSF